jgi:hypothetical protein
MMVAAVCAYSSGNCNSGLGAFSLIEVATSPMHEKLNQESIVEDVRIRFHTWQIHYSYH